MAQTITIARPWHTWVVGILSLLFNSGGAFDYTMTHLHDPAYLKMVTPEQLAWIENFPVWATSAWALGVWGAFGGSLLLLLRSRWAVLAFEIALVGLAGTTLYQWGISGMPESLKTSGGMAFAAVIWIVTGLLLWYVMRMRARGVLR